MSRAPSSLTRRWRGSLPGSPRPVPHTHTGTNLRFRGKYSELFIVFNESRETLRRGFPDLQSRALSVKIAAEAIGPHERDDAGHTSDLRRSRP